MNCRDVTLILDNQKGALDPAQRQEVEAHMATCAECASAWHLQAGLADLPFIALPAGFSSRCRMLVAATPPSIIRRPAVNRRVLWGTLTALAAAAALLFIPSRQPTVTPPADTAPLAPVEAARPIPETASAAPPVDEPPPVPAEPSTPLHFLVRVIRPGSDAGSGCRVMQSGFDCRESAFTEQLRAVANEPSRKQAIDSLRDALIEELRAVPGLVLVEADLASMEPSSSRKYQLRVAGVTASGPDGKPVQGSSRQVMVMLRAEQIRANGESVIRLMDNASIDLQAPCTGAAPNADAPCPDARGTAVAIVRKLREEVFPPDPSVMRGLQANIGDRLLDATQRSRSLFDLLRIQDNVGDPGLLRNPAVVRAVIDLAGSADPALRARIWRTMRGVASRDLIQPLKNSLLNDPADVRIAALETLADFRDDTHVRSTLESVARDDPRPLIRAVAERSLSGEESWKRYVVASLKDSSRPAAQRIEALAYYLYPPGPAEEAPSRPDYSQVMQELLDDAAVTALAEALPNAGSLNGYGHVNNLVGIFAVRNSRNPAVTEMLLTFLANDSRPEMRSVAGDVLARMHASEPQVRAALDKAIQNDPDPSVRDYIRQRIPPPARAPGQ